MEVFWSATGSQIGTSPMGPRLGKVLPNRVRRGNFGISVASVVGWVLVTLFCWDEWVKLPEVDSLFGRIACRSQLGGAGADLQGYF